MSGDEGRGVSEPRGQYGSSCRPVSTKTAILRPILCIYKCFLDLSIRYYIVYSIFPIYTVCTTSLTMNILLYRMSEEIFRQLVESVASELDTCMEEYSQKFLDRI